MIRGTTDGPGRLAYHGFRAGDVIRITGSSVGGTKRLWAGIIMEENDADRETDTESDGSASDTADNGSGGPDQARIAAYIAYATNKGPLPPPLSGKSPSLDADSAEVTYCHAPIASLTFGAMPWSGKCPRLDYSQWNSGFGRETNWIDGEFVTKDLQTSGVVAGEIKAYRCWLDLMGENLCSIYNDYVWAPGRVEEANLRMEWSGFYSFKHPGDAAEMASWHGSAIVGEVLIWGDVIEHKLGYRSQFAKVMSISDPGLAEKFGVPVYVPEVSPSRKKLIRHILWAAFGALCAAALGPALI